MLTAATRVWYCGVPCCSGPDPHHALPCPTQILCVRMRVLVVPQPPTVLPPPGVPQAAARRRDNYAPNILKGYWGWAPEQKKLLPRLR